MTLSNGDFIASKMKIISTIKRIDDTDVFNDVTSTRQSVITRVVIRFLCNKNELGDEFHYLFNCEYFSRSRLKLLPVWSYQSPNIVKFEQLMTSNDRIILTKLALFIKIILTKFR